MKAAEKKSLNRKTIVLACCVFAAALASAQTGFRISHKYELLKLPEPATTRTGPYRHPVMLPWSTECLPFFCRIEHDMGLNNKVPVKFRLGSVEYVDWLEGKNKTLDGGR
jgi:hypothetical protein